MIFQVQITWKHDGTNYKGSGMFSITGKTGVYRFLLMHFTIKFFLPGSSFYKSSLSSACKFGILVGEKETRVS